jgi:predicted MFS family arabinose efflux permease
MSWGDLFYNCIGLAVAFWLAIKADLSFRDLLDWRETFFFIIAIALWTLVLAIYFVRRNPSC